MKTFRMGGVHPAANKLSAGVAIRPADIPEVVAIPMAQNLGAPSKPVVAKGDKVKVGTVIAEPGGFLSSYIHSSVSGTVDKIDAVPDATGKKVPAVFIKVEGDEWEESIDRSTTVDRQLKITDPKELVDRIFKSGIVGMGGATFPTQVKLAPPPGMKCEVVIINAVECEPYLTSDHSLMLEHAEEILVGVTALMRAMQVERAIIGIEANKPDAIALMTEKASTFSGITIQPLKLKYPQGGEKQLIDACIGKQVPSGGLPIATGALVQNVGTAFAVYQAVQKNKPLFERIVTVTGKSLKQPSNFLARIGVPIANLIEAAGGLPEDTGKVISGGPMMGKAMPAVNSYMVKGCSGILIMPSAEAQRKEAQPCIRCAKCVDACPMGLSPLFISKYSQKHMWAEAEEERIYDCIECGSCSFTCPSHRPLLDWIRQGKGKVMGIMRQRAAEAKAKAEAEKAKAENK